jgi:hypothetical protein
LPMMAIYLASAVSVVGLLVYRIQTARNNGRGKARAAERIRSANAD